MADWLREHDGIIDLRNQRIKIMNCNPQRLAELVTALPRLAAQVKAGKITVYAKKQETAFFIERGFLLEGCISGFFQGTNAYLLSLFPDPKRGQTVHQVEEDEILHLCQQQKMAYQEILPNTMVLRPACDKDIEGLTALFRQVFAKYPTPVYDPDYVKEVMDDHVDFMVIEEGKKIICAASADISRENGCAELTDCATHPDYRGQGLLSHLFFALENHLQQKGIYYLFSLTRAMSAPMNITTARHGYQYQGRLVNNCVISTGFEDMNIWVKPLRKVRD